LGVVRTRPDTQQGPAGSFTGTVWFDQIAAGVPPSRLRAYTVHFSPGARTAWHTHPNGQILHVTEGVGRVQSRGGHVQEVRAGDTVVIEPGEWHWHGAAPHNLMTHLGLHELGDDGSDAEWGDHVTDAEYLGPTGERDRSPG
jgi:quercetin dioxygenase-like cupin family protein